MMKTLPALLLMSSAWCVFADGPIGPTIDDRLLRQQREQAAAARIQAAYRFEAEQRERAANVAAEQQRRLAAAQQREVDKVREQIARERELAALNAQRASAEAGRLHSRLERERLAELSKEWRIVHGQTQNLAWAGWTPLAGRVLDTHDGWMRVRLTGGAVIYLTNYFMALADGEALAANTVGAVGDLHKYAPTAVVAAKDTGVTLRRYDCGFPCAPPPGWLANEPIRRATEESLRPDEDRQTAYDQAAGKADAERLVRAAQEVEEKERAHYNAQLIAYQERAAATALRVLAYHHQHASNGLGSYQFELGRRYLKGEGVPQNKTLARFWLHSACTNGLSEATNLLGTVDHMLEIVTDSK